MHTVIPLLQGALTPAFLLVGLGSLLNLFAARLARIIDRGRTLETRHAASEGEERRRIVTELHAIERRNAIVSRAILFGVIAALVVCAMIALLFLMELTGLHLQWVIAGAFVLALGFLSGSLLMFLKEVQVAQQTVHVRDEVLRHEGSEP